jgi:integrase/recombinase XerD
VPETGRARLSYRRAEEIFEENTRLLANPLASPDDIEELDGWTLHRLRHRALTHDAEDGTSTPLLLARSRHAPSAPWSGTPAPASTRSPGTSPRVTQLSAAVAEQSKPTSGLLAPRSPSRD